MSVLKKAAPEFLSRNKIATKTGLGPTRTNRALHRLQDHIEEKESVNPQDKSKTIEVFRWKPTPSGNKDANQTTQQDPLF